MISMAMVALLNCITVKIYLRVFITKGRNTSWRLASVDLLAVMRELFSKVGCRGKAKR